MVRVNGLDTPFMYRDLIDIVESAGQFIDSIMLPKVGCAADIYMLDCLLTQIETAYKIEHKIAIEALIENVHGASRVGEIAAASQRLQALHFGAGDFAASCGARVVNIGGLHEDFPGDPWHPLMQNIVVACRANGLRAIDSAYGDFSDKDGYIASAKRAAILGFSGKWAIHPSQIVLANTVMSPTEAEVSEAEKIIAAMKEAETNNKGAASVNGRMVDIASVRMAEHILSAHAASK